MPHFNTLRVIYSTPSIITLRVQSHEMKSVGERIRQARNAQQMSGEELALKVGYKNQSAIGNLENRAGGTGGSRITKISDILQVPVEWLLRGPDSEDIPLLRFKIGLTNTAHHGSSDELSLKSSPATLRFAYRAGIVQGGDNGYIEDYASTPNGQEPEPVPYASTKQDEQAYAVKVRGNSMEPTIMAGWDVVASPSRPAEPPDLCVVYFTNERKALKRLLWRRDGLVCLESISEAHGKITEPIENIIRMDKVISIVPN